MKEFWNTIQLIFAAIGGWLGWFLGGYDGLLYALLAFVAVDYGFAPKIQMEGRWLEKLGFPIGTHLVVEYEEGSIRIRPFTEEETAAIEEQKLQAELARKQQEYEAARRSLAKQYGAFTMVAEANSNYGTDSTTRPQRKK